MNSSLALRSRSLLWVLLATNLLPAAASARWARFALVVGYNESDDRALAPLRYADDDAVKYAELFSFATDKTILLTDLDAESARVYGPMQLKSPTRKNLLASLDELRTDVAAALKRGDKPILYFVYSGHGNYDQEGRGYVHLEDGRWTTRDLYYHILGPSRGEAPHNVILIVDSCNSALLVNSRGSDHRKVTGTSLKLEAYPNVGVVLSSSTIGEVHEWGKYLSGVFSHEVRSALLGPADLDDDGQVTFAELAAFVASANAEVKNETYRVRPYIRPPLSAPNLALMSLADAHFPARVRIDPQVTGPSYLFGRELLRIADFNKTGEQGFWLALPGTDGFVVVNDKHEYVVPAKATGVLRLTGLETRPATVLSARGPSAYFEERLFARPYGRDGARSWLQKSYADTLVVERFEKVAWYKNKGAWGLLGGGLAVIGGGIAFNVAAVNADDAADAVEFGDQIAANNDAASRNEKIATAFYSVGGAAVLGSALWFALDRKFQVERYAPPLRVDLTPTGVLLSTPF